MKAIKQDIPATLCATLLAALAALPAAAQTVPPLINYQGRLVNSNNIPLATGDYELRFSLWDAATGGTQVWGPQLFNGMTGAGFGPKVPVVHGWFNVMLGPVDTNGARLADAFTGTNRFVEVQVGSNPPLSPRQQILSTPYAFMAANLAPGVAAANLAASGLSGVASGGLILSATDNPTLNSAGFLKIGTTTLNDVWLERSTNTAPVPRSSHSAVWTGTEMIVWGGVGDGINVYLNSDGRYNAASNTWMPLSTNSGLAERTWQTAVWTGTEMIIWGGYASDGSVHFFNDGARYNPATDTWTPVTTSGAPSPRHAHTAVWTGSEMIVWGGSDYLSNLLNDGKRYNPATDSWTPVASGGALSPRHVHSAVWTGTEMLVWGGAAGTGGSRIFFADGGRYNPASDSWTSITSIGVPTARFWHTTVWTGAEMIVWGGGDSGGYMNTGGRYNPTANTWTTVPTAGAPTPRQEFPPIWTGTEMIIWGGIDRTYTRLNDGGRYNPSANMWVAIRGVGAPGARANHAAVWTGTEMIVFGGVRTSLLNDTWSYTPGKAMFLYQKP